MKSFECPKTIRNYEKNNAWSMSHSSHQPSDPAYYIEDCRIFGVAGLECWCQN